MLYCVPGPAAGRERGAREARYVAVATSFVKAICKDKYS